MKQEDLFDAIGGIREDYLTESETMIMRRPLGLSRVVLVAAVLTMLVFSVAAGSYLLSKPIEDGGVEREDVTVDCLDSQMNYIASREESVLWVLMDMELDTDIPVGLQCTMMPMVSQDWKIKTFTHVTGNTETEEVVTQFSFSWKNEQWEEDENVVYSQSSVYGLVEKNDTWCVSFLPNIPGEAEVTSGIATIANREVFVVNIPGVAENVEGMEQFRADYMDCGETRIFWCDGSNLFELQCPAWMSMEDVAALINSICAVDNIMDYAP